MDMICLNGYHVINLVLHMQAPAVMQASQIQKVDCIISLVNIVYLVISCSLEDIDSLLFLPREG